MVPITSYAQNFEDVLLWRALAHVTEGFYVDVGAHDPVVDSVSLAFYEQGWRGVHVEPTATYAERLRSARPDETVLQAAVSDAPGLLTFYDIAQTGLSTLDADLAARHRSEGYDVRETEVPAITLDELLARHQGRDIHWLKIDVEGFEERVLHGWTSAAPHPWIVVVESTVPMTQQDSSAAWEPALLALGYRFVHFDGLNRFYVASAHPELVAAFAAPPNVFDRFVLSGTASSSFAQRVATLKAEVEAGGEALRALQGELEIATRDAMSLRERLAAVEANLSEAAAARDAALREAYFQRDMSDGLAEQLEVERKNVQQAEARLQDTLTRLDALQDEIAHHRRLEALVAQLNERQHAHDTAMAEVLASQRRIGELTRELTESHANVLHLRASHAQAVQAAAAASAAYESIRHSRSWRVTAPLRHLFGLGRWLRDALVGSAKRVVRLPRRAAKRALLSGLTYVRAHPERKEQVARMLRRSRRLDARLRQFAAVNRGGAVRVPPPLAPATEVVARDTRSSPSLESGGVPAGRGTVQDELRRSLSEWPLGSRRNV